LEQYLSQVCHLPPEFSLALRKKMFMVMGTLDADALIKALFHVQAICESQVELVEMLVRALKPIFEPNMIPKLTPLVTIDEPYSQKVLMGLYNQPAPPVDVKPLSIETTESYIVAQLETLYWSMLLAEGFSEANMPRRISLMNPLPKDLRPDFKISCGNTVVQCHSWVLFGRWPWFRRLVDSGLSEISQMSISLPEDCWSTQTLHAFLRYLYTNSVGLFDSNTKTCNELLDNARLFDLLDVDNNPTSGFAPLIEHCSAPYSTNVTVKTAVSSYQRLLLFGSSSQRKQLKRFIAQNLTAIMEDEKLAAEFASLGAKTCAAIMFSVYDREWPSGARIVATSSDSAVVPIPPSSAFSAPPPKKKDKDKDKSPKTTRRAKA
jgi:hypothetical protein